MLLEINLWFKVVKPYAVTKTGSNKPNCEQKRPRDSRATFNYYSVGAIVVVIVIEAKEVRPPKPYINYNLVVHISKTSSSE